MRARVIALAWVFAFSGASVVFAEAAGPAELPAADYAGQSYVDSRGCIFLKAGYGGDATWVPRVGQDRKPICGQAPTKAVAQMATATRGKPVVQSTAKSRKARQAAPLAPVMIGCPASVPVARRYATTDGGSVVICTAKNGSLTGARSPIYPEGSPVGAALSKSRGPGVDIPLPQGSAAASTSEALVAPPAGYEPAWKDGRFNPLRGKSVAGNQSAALAPEKPAAAAPKASGSYYVQIGTYGEPANAEGVRARLKDLGLPVSNGKFTKQGRALQVVYAGPFASGAEAQAALTAARSNGFADSFIR